MMSSSDLLELSKEDLVARIRKLQDQADHDRRRADGLAEELKQAKEHNVAVQKQVEQEEEFITNKLMKRLEQLKREKAVLASEVEQEEDFLVNTLHKRLEKLAKEKVDLENRLTAEQEYIMNRLQGQLDMLGKEKQNLVKEKTDLQRQVADLGASVDRLNKDKVNLENQLEMEEESITNKLQRQLEAVIYNLRLIESKLEGKGMTLKDLGISPGDLHSDVPKIYSRSPSSTGGSFDRGQSGSMHAGSMPTHGAMHIVGSRRERPLSAQSGSLNGGALNEVYAK